jgi:hypothetical protein
MEVKIDHKVLSIWLSGSPVDRNEGLFNVNLHWVYYMAMKFVQTSLNWTKFNICDPCSGITSRNAHFCDNFSTTQPITLFRLPWTRYHWNASGSAVSPIKFFYLIYISSGGNFHMKNMTPLPIVCFAFLNPLHSPSFAIRNNIRCSGVISYNFWDFGVQTWPNLHKIHQNMQIRSNLGPKILKVVWDNPLINTLYCCKLQFKANAAVRNTK